MSSLVALPYGIILGIKFEHIYVQYDKLKNTYIALSCVCVWGNDYVLYTMLVSAYYFIGFKLSIEACYFKSKF